MSENSHPSESVPPISNATNVVGKGTYGFILKPALSNRRLNGSVEEYPNEVTKAYFNQKSLNGAIKTGAKIYSLTGNEGHKLIPYKQPYRASNMPASITAKLKTKDFGKTDIAKIYGRSSMPIAHMKNLGIDMIHTRLTAHVAALRKIPIGLLLEQVLKVLNQVKIFIDNKFIHGDIRPANMMINPDTGIITIIDFDLFEEIPDFMKNNVAFYNRPPENYIHDFFRDPYSIVSFDKIDKAPYIKAVKNNTSYIVKYISPPYHDSLETYIKTINDLTLDKSMLCGIDMIMPYLRDLLSREGDRFKNSIKSHDTIKNEYFHDRYTLEHYIYYNNDHTYLSDKLTHEKLLDILDANRKYFVDKYIIGDGLTVSDITEEQVKTQWAKMIVPYFDGFGLAVSLLELLSVAKYDDAHIDNLRDNVLMKMAAWKLEDRIDIVEAIKRTEAIIAEAKPKVAAAASVNNAVAAAVAAAKAALAAKAVKPAAASVNNAVAAASAALAAKAGKAGGRRKTQRRKTRRCQRSHRRTCQRRIHSTKPIRSR